MINYDGNTYWSRHYHYSIQIQNCQSNQIKLTPQQVLDVIMFTFLVCGFDCFSLNGIGCIFENSKMFVFYYGRGKALQKIQVSGATWYVQFCYFKYVYSKYQVRLVDVLVLSLTISMPDTLTEGPVPAVLWCSFRTFWANL